MTQCFLSLTVLFAGIEPICDELIIKQICLDDVAKKANAELKPFKFEEREKQSEEIIDEIVEAYKARRGKVTMNLLPEHGNDHTLTGVSEGSLKEFLGEKRKPLIDLIVSGDIKGVAGVVGCSNLTAGGHDVLTVDLVKELISRDIIVLTAGCYFRRDRELRPDDTGSCKTGRTKTPCSLRKTEYSSGTELRPMSGHRTSGDRCHELAELWKLISHSLPLVLSAAQWLEEQALADGCFGLALGLPLHLGLPPFVTGSDLAVKISN